MRIIYKYQCVYRVLSCVVYYLIDNYVFIDYLSFQLKTLSSISYKPKFGDTSFNILLGIGITELLLNLVSCHGFMKKPDSTVIWNCRSHLIKNSLSTGFYIIKKDSKQLSFFQMIWNWELIWLIKLIQIFSW